MPSSDRNTAHEGIASVSGVVEDIIFQNKANDYTVLCLSTAEDELVTAVGILPLVREGESVVLYGEWSFHPSYGPQFAVQSYERSLPTDQDQMVKYLASGAIKGIGPVTAYKIVSRFGESSFDVIQNHPQWLADIPGITKKKAAEISRVFSEQSGMQQLMLCCRDFLSIAAISKVYRQWGKRSVELIKQNPYSLTDESLGIPFERADTLAQSLGFQADSACRIAAGLQYVLRHNANTNGHTCLPRAKLVAVTAAHLHLSEEQVLPVLLQEVQEGHLIAFLPKTKDYIFDKRSDEAEAYIAAKLLSMEAACIIMDTANIGQLVRMVETEKNITYAKLQRQAIEQALCSGVLILTGGPGTGKTTVVQALLRIFRHTGMKVALAAPTGRAAKRLSEATGEEAKTIHRMLEMTKSDGETTLILNRNEGNPLAEDVIILDEASMIDLFLMEGLLRATKRGTRLIFIGDDNQLPPVGCGNVLRDMIASGAFTTICLTEIFRQSEQSMIVVNAHRINRGEVPLLENKYRDFFFLPREEDEQIAQTILQLVTQRLPRTYGEDVLRQIQIISPSRKGKAGTERLNHLLREYLNPKDPSKGEVNYREGVFRVGDKVMQIRNNYELSWTKDGIESSGVFNGDIGIITDINPSKKNLLINFEDRVATYDFALLDEIEHAYAITVHKSQGSEYPLVIFPLFHCPPMLRTRNLFYTALTRAREMVILVGSEQIARQMAENNRHVMRYTALEERLRR
ncbi:MAG: ATP-dependent RecD-like DNA helicase [Eubacteriales bacterium]